MWRRSWKRRPEIPTARSARCHAGVEGRRSERAARLTGEDEVLGTGRRPRREVRLKVRDDDRWDRHVPHAGVGLRWAEHERAVAELLVLLDDRHGAVEQVEVDLAERAELADAEAAERGEQDHRSIAGFDGVGDRVDLLDRGDRSLGGSLDRRALDDARVAGDEAVLERCGADGVEQPVALGDGRRAGWPASMRPARHERTVAGVMSASSMEPSVGRMCSRSRLGRSPACGAQIRAVGEPPRGVVGEWHLAGFGVDPVAALEVGAGGGEPAVGEALRAERLRRGPPDALDLVARLPPARRQLAGIPPRSTGHGRSVARKLWHECGTPGLRAVIHTCGFSESAI